MDRYAKKLIGLVFRRSEHIPNLLGLDLRPGTILRKTNGLFEVAGTVEDGLVAGPGYDVEVVRKAVERTKPEPVAAGDVPQAVINYKSAGATIVKSNVGVDFPMMVGGISSTVKCNVVAEFSKESDYIFNAASSSRWFVFDPSETDDVHAAAMSVMKKSDALVIGALYTPRITAHIAKTKKTTLGFEAKAGADLSGFGIDQLADLKASVDVGLSLSVQRGETLDIDRQNLVGMFRVLVKKRTFSGTDVFRHESISMGAAPTAAIPHLGPDSMDLLAPDEADLLGFLGI